MLRSDFTKGEEGIVYDVPTGLLDNTVVTLVPSRNAPGEIWKPITSAPEYQVSSLGRVRRHGRVLKTHLTAKGEPYATILGKKRGLARLVAVAFLPDPYRPDAIVQCRDGDRLNVAVSNLAWGTRSRRTRLKFLPLDK